MFDVEAGVIGVAGPTGFKVDDEEYGDGMARIGLNFTLTVVGSGLGSGLQQVRILPFYHICGGPGSSENSPYLEGALTESPDLPGEGENLLQAQSWGPLRLNAVGAFAMCWCPGSQDACSEDADFFVAIPGSLEVTWHDTVGPQVLDEDGGLLRPLPNVEFTMRVSGEGLSHAGRIRIVELQTSCGTSDASTNTEALLGTLATDPDTPGVVGSGHATLSWPGLRLSSGGVRRVCWCSGGFGENACTSGLEFYTEIGTFETLGMRNAWVDPCTRAGKPFRAHVAAVGLRPRADRVLVARASDVCGEALPRGLRPGRPISSDFGFAALECVEDPNAGAVLGERKMVCGDLAGDIRVAEPGLYKVCFCGVQPRYDCSHFSHFRVPAGGPFEVTDSGLPSLDLEFHANSGEGLPRPMVLNGPSPVMALAYSPVASAQDRRVAAAYQDGMIRLWELEEPRMVSQIVGSSARVEALAWAPDGSWLVSGAADGMMSLWGAAAGVAPRASPAHPCPDWAPAWQRPGGDASDEEWQDVILGHILDLVPRNVQDEPRAYRQDRLSATDLRDWPNLNVQLASRQCEKACATYREMALARCECGPTFECHFSRTCVPRCGMEDRAWRAHERRVTAVAVSPDGELIASASADQTVRLWRAGGTSDAPAAVIGEAFGAAPRAVLALAFSPPSEDGHALLAAGSDDGLLLWLEVRATGAGGATVAERLRREELFGLGVPVQSVAFSADGRWFAAAGERGSALWNANAFTQVLDLEHVSSEREEDLPPPGARKLAFTEDGNWLALQGPDGLQLYPLADVEDEPDGEWVKFDGTDLAGAVRSWQTTQGPEDNEPQYWTDFFGNGSMALLHFAPCTTSRGCGELLPAVQLDVEVPFEFTRVRGSFVEYSTGENPSDDCRGGASHSSWDDHDAAFEYFSRLGSAHVAEGKDCRRIGPLGDTASYSLQDCQRLCMSLTDLCNLVNYRQNPASCDLRRCLNATSPGMAAQPDTDVWAFVQRRESFERQDPSHGGYVMFGAPSGFGTGGVLYGGCGSSPHIPPEPDGARISVSEQEVSRTRKLRWQVSQDMPTETVAIGRVALELYHPNDKGRRISSSIPSPSVALAVASSLREMAHTVGANGDIAIWDLRSLDFPDSFVEYLPLRRTFNLQVSGQNLRDTDRLRIVSEAVVPACGASQSAETSRQIAGVDAGTRSFGDWYVSHWRDLAPMAMGSYLACFCGWRRGICCDGDADFATELRHIVVPGVENDHYAICEVTSDEASLGGTKSCQVLGVRGYGLLEGDMLMVQDGTTCGLGSPITTLYNNGVMVSRVPHPIEDLGEWAPGTFFRFESQSGNYGTENALGPEKYEAMPSKVQIGRMSMLCWCSATEGCSPSSPGDFTQQAGTVTLIKMGADVGETCYERSSCKVKLTQRDNTPITEGDRVLVMSGQRPSERLLGCDGNTTAGLGPNGDGYSARATVDESGNRVVFDLGLANSEIGTYRLCWCQASVRPCETAADYAFDIGFVTVREASGGYVWPDCTFKTQFFADWRQGRWTTFDDCCCNYAEAGSVGCWDKDSHAYATCLAVR